MLKLQLNCASIKSWGETKAILLLLVDGRVLFKIVPSSRSCYGSVQSAVSFFDRFRILDDVRHSLPEPSIIGHLVYDYTSQAGSILPAPGLHVPTRVQKKSAARGLNEKSDEEFTYSEHSSVLVCSVLPMYTCTASTLPYPRNSTNFQLCRRKAQTTSLASGKLEIQNSALNMPPTMYLTSV